MWPSYSKVVAVEDPKIIQLQSRSSYTQIEIELQGKSSYKADSSYKSGLAIKQI